MQSHQRYFPLGGARFAFVANGGDPGVVRTGNERVLEGRLDDARFSYERDVQVGIEAMAEQLDSITFHARAGTFADKAVRLRELCDLLGGGEASGEAARLAKADQASTMVHEFPELEGFIGGEYARLAGVPEGVCGGHRGALPPGPGGRAAAGDGSRTRAFRRRQDRQPRRRLRARRATDGLARPVRAAPGGDRALPARGRRRARDRLGGTGRPRPRAPDRTRRGGNRRRLRRARVRARAPGGTPRRPGRVRARGQALGPDRAWRRRAPGPGASRGGKLASFRRCIHGLRPGEQPCRQGERGRAGHRSRPGPEPAERALLETLAEAGPRIDAAVQARDFGAALEAASELGPPSTGSSTRCT